MAYIINSEGEVIEGQALSKDEAELLQELTESIQDAARKEGTYLRETASRSIVLHIISVAKLERRQVEPAPVEDELDTRPYMVPAPVQVVELPDAEDAEPADLEDVTPL